MASEKRKFTAQKADGSILSLTTRKPTEKETGAAEKQYRLSFTDALQDGLPTRSILLRRLEDGGQWTEEDQSEFRDLRDAYRVALDAANVTPPKDTDSDDVKAAYSAACKKRDDAFTALTRKKADIDSMLQFTADSLAESARMNFLVACTTELDGLPVKKLWAKLSDLLAAEATGDDLVEHAKYEFMTFNNGLPDEWDLLTGKVQPVPAESQKVEDMDDQVSLEEEPSPAAAVPPETQPATEAKAA